MILAYDRIERIGTDKARMVEEWKIPVEKEPIMTPDRVPHCEKAGYWHRISRGAGFDVIETWRLMEAERLVA